MSKKTLSGLVFCILIYFFAYGTFLRDLNSPPVNDEIQYQLNNYFFSSYSNFTFGPEYWETDENSFDQTLLGRYFYGYIQSRILRQDPRLFMQEYERVAILTGDDRWDSHISGWDDLLSKSPFFYRTTREIRKIIFPLSAISIVSLFLLIYLTYESYLLAAFCVFCVLQNGNFIHLSCAVRNDWLFLMFFLFSLLSVSLSYRFHMLKMSRVTWVAAGMFVGLSLAAKLTGFMTTEILIAGVIAGTVIAKMKGIAIRIQPIRAGLGVCTLVACGIFFCLHPNIWRNPYRGLFQYFSFREKVISIQQHDFPRSTLHTFRDRSNTFILYTLQSDTVRLVLFLSGIIFCLAGLFRSGNNRQLVLKITLFGWFSGIMVSVYFLSPLNWWQYYYVAMPVTAFFTSYALYVPIRYFINISGKKFRRIPV